MMKGNSSQEILEFFRKKSIYFVGNVNGYLDQKGPTTHSASCCCSQRSRDQLTPIIVACGFVGPDRLWKRWQPGNVDNDYVPVHRRTIACDQ
jgi:hypothetical protein